MTQPATAQTPQPQLSGDDVVKWVVILVLVFGGLVAMLFARRVVSPIDDLATQQVCRIHGEEIGRELVSYQRSNRLSLVNRADGSCLYGPAEGGADQLLVPLPDANPGSLYSAAKVMTFILQLGAASLVVRVMADPLLDRFVRSPDQPVQGP